MARLVMSSFEDLLPIRTGLHRYYTLGRLLQSKKNPSNKRQVSQVRRRTRIVTLGKAYPRDVTQTHRRWIGQRLLAGCARRALAEPRQARGWHELSPGYNTDPEAH